MKIFLKTLLLLIYNSAFIIHHSFSQAPGIEWEKSLGGTNNDFANSVQQTSDGGYIVAGYSESNNGNVSGNHGGYDYWVVKLTSAGIIQWQKSLGGTGDDVARSARQTFNGGYIVVGHTASNNGNISGNHGGHDCWVVNLDNNGIILWQKCLGGTLDDDGSDVQQTADGGYIVACQSLSNNGDVSGNHDPAGTHPDYWIVKLNSAGVIEWQKCLGGSRGDAVSSIQLTTVVTTSMITAYIIII